MTVVTTSVECELCVVMFVCPCALCRYLPDANDGHDVAVDHSDGIRPAAAPRVAKATPGTALASLPHASLRGAGAVHGNARD